MVNGTVGKLAELAEIDQVRVEAGECMNKRGAD